MAKKTTTTSLKHELGSLDKEEKQNRERIEEEKASVHQQIANAQTEAIKAEQRVAEIETQRQELASAAFSGDENAEQELGRLQEELRSLLQRAELAKDVKEQGRKRLDELEVRSQDAAREAAERRYDLYARARRERSEKVESLSVQLREELEGLIGLASEHQAIARTLQMSDGLDLRIILAQRLGTILGDYVPNGRSQVRLEAPVSEADYHTQSLHEQRAANEESVRRNQEIRAQQRAAREARAHRQVVEARRAQIRANLGWNREGIVPSDRARIDAQADERLRAEFPELARNNAPDQG